MVVTRIPGPKERGGHQFNLRFNMDAVMVVLLVRFHMLVLRTLSRVQQTFTRVSYSPAEGENKHNFIGLVVSEKE